MEGDNESEQHTQLSSDIDDFCMNSQESTVSSQVTNESEVYNAWENWTDEQKAILAEHLNYKLDVLTHVKKEIEQINLAWQSGPLDKNKKLKSVKKPTSSLDSLLFTSEGKTNKKQNMQNMSDLEFNDYLKRHKTDRQISHDVDCFVGDNLEVLAKRLKSKFAHLKEKECDILNDKIEFGLMLLDAKRLFKQKKASKLVKGSWYQWVDANTEICKSYANRCIFVADFVKQYPKLRTLNMCFSDLYRIIGKMKSVFKNTEIANSWK